jgi:hypothetical protein
VADDKRVAEQELEEMLMAMNRHRNAGAAYSDKGDSFGVARCKRVLQLDHSRIRRHCAKHDLELPHDVPPEDTE